MNKNLKKLKWEDIPAEDEKLTILTSGVDESKINIPKVIIKGEKFVNVFSDGTWTGIIPEAEISAYRSRIKGRWINQTIDVIVKRKLVGKTGTKIAVFSIKEYELKEREEDLNMLVNSDYVMATIELLEDFQAVLSYGKVKNLILTTPSFTHKGGLSVKDFFSKGDKIPVKFDRYKKNGREIRVLPFIEVKEDDFEKPFIPKNIEEGDVILGKVFSTKPNSVLIAVGKRENSNIPQQAYSRHHPAPEIDDYLVAGMPVLVSVRSIHFTKNGDLRLNVSILDALTDYKEQKRIEYLSEIADLLIEDNLEVD